MSKVIKVSAMTAMSTMRLASLLFLSKSKPKLSADEAHQQGPGLTPKPFGEARMMSRSRWHYRCYIIEDKLTNLQRFGTRAVYWPLANTSG